MFPDIRALLRPAFAALAGLAITILPVSTAHALQGEGFAQDRSDILADPAIRYGQLENGLRYAIMVNSTPPDNASIRLVFNAGSLAEADDQRGLAHFIEHMAFNGTVNVPEGEMVALLERFGLQFGPDTNAGTGREYVVYQLDMPEVDDETVDTGLFIMRETASNMTLDIEAIDRERDIILSEERVRDTPVRRWSNALMEFRYPDSLVARRDAIGITEVIQTAPREAFVRYYDTYYTPGRAMLVIVGDIDADRVETEIAATFGDWVPSGTDPADPVAGSVDTRRAFESGYFHDPEFFTVLTVDSIHPDIIEADTAASRFDGLLDRLATSIVSRRMSTIISTGTSPLLQGGAGYSTDEYGFAARANILAVAQPDRWEEGLALVEQELRRALEHGFTQAELDEQLTNLRTALETAVEQADTRASSSLSDALWSSWRFNQVFGHPADTLARYNSIEDAITLEAVHAAFRDQWAGNGPLVFLATSLEIDDAEARIADVWNESAQTAVDAMEDVEIAAWAYEDFGTPGEVVERTEIDDLGVTRLVFGNGVRVSLKPTNFEDDVIRINMTFGRGDIEPRQEAVVDTVASSIFTSGGLEAHSFDDLSRILAGRNVGGGFNVNAGSFNMSATTTPADLGLQFQLLAAYMTAPGYRPESMAQFRASLPELRRNLGSTPAGVRSRDVARMLRSGDPRYGFPSEAETDAVDLDDVRAFLGPALESAPIEIAVVGDFEEQAVIDAIAATLGALPPRADNWPDYPENRILEFPEATAEPVLLTHNGGDDQALVNVYWPTTDDSDVRASRVIRLMRAVMALKLTERLREREAFTYSASSSNVESFYHPGYGYLYVGADIRAGNIEPVYEAIGQIAADMANGEITDDELLRARRPLLEQIQNAFESNPAWLGWLSQSFEYPERLDRIRTIADDYSDITLEEIVDAASTYLDEEMAYRVTIIPASSQ